MDRCSISDYSNVPAVEYYVDLTHVICAPFTVSLNLLVFYIAVRWVKFRSRLNQSYVLLMTTADLVYAIVYMSTKMVNDCFPREFCRIYYILTWSSQILSLASLLLLNVDKFISIYWPLHYHQIVNDFSVTLQLSTAGLIALSYSIFSFTGPFSQFKVENVNVTLANANVVGSSNECSIDFNPHYYLWMLFLFYIVPIVISTILSLYIFTIAQRIAKRTTVPAKIKGFPAASRHGGRAASTANNQKLMKRVLFVFSSTLWTMMTTLPYRATLSAYFLCRSYNLYSNCYDLLGIAIYAFWFLIPIGAIGNPIVTIITQKIYRQRARRMCCVGKTRYYASRAVLTHSSIINDSQQ